MYLAATFQITPWILPWILALFAFEYLVDGSWSDSGRFLPKADQVMLYDVSDDDSHSMILFLFRKKEKEVFFPPLAGTLYQVRPGRRKRKYRKSESNITVINSLIYRNQSPTLRFFLKFAGYRNWIIKREWYRYEWNQKSWNIDRLSCSDRIERRSTVGQIDRRNRKEHPHKITTTSPWNQSSAGRRPGGPGEESALKKNNVNHVADRYKISKVLTCIIHQNFQTMMYNID